MAELYLTSWKVAAIGIAVVVSTVLITAFVVGNWSSQETVGPVREPRRSQRGGLQDPWNDAPRAVAQQAPDTRDRRRQAVGGGHRSLKPARKVGHGR
jgi:hypothetical protein